MHARTCARGIPYKNNLVSELNYILIVSDFKRLVEKCTTHISNWCTPVHILMIGKLQRALYTSSRLKHAHSSTKCAIVRQFMLWILNSQLVGPMKFEVFHYNLFSWLVSEQYCLSLVWMIRNDVMSCGNIILWCLVLCHDSNFTESASVR